MKNLPTKESLLLTQKIAENIETFHHHYHVLYDIAQSYPEDYWVNYVEIGCYAGGSAALMLNRPKTNVYSIDSGGLISPDIVKKNINNLNLPIKRHFYIQGKSEDSETFKKLKEHILFADILFIDGDHSYQAVKKDFYLYEQIVKKGGYIVFDDYSDFKFNPQVRPAVDEIVRGLDSSWKIIGTFPNTLKAHPETMTEGNVFIIQKP